MEEAWFLMVPMLLLARDKPELGKAVNGIARLIPIGAVRQIAPRHC